MDNSWLSDSTASVTCDGNTDSCCSGLTLTSTGGIATTYPDLLGTYTQGCEVAGDHMCYSKGSNVLFFLNDVLHHFEGWTISDSTGEIGPVTNVGPADCAEDAGDDWEYLDTANGAWVEDATLALECEQIAECCQAVILSSSGQAKDMFPDLMGSYTQTGFENGRPVYTGPSSTQRKYVNDVAHHWEGWVVGEGLGSLSHDGDASCPVELGEGWDVADGNNWVRDETVQILCDF